jgi:hypothetical protein
MTGKVPWNHGLTWEEMYDSEVLQRQQATRQSRISGAQRALAESQELEQRRREKLSQVARRRGLGGYERGSGRGKKGWYRGHWCDSTYELAFVVWALDHEIPFVRNLEFFPYEYQGKVMRWTPDFSSRTGRTLRSRAISRTRPGRSSSTSCGHSRSSRKPSCGACLSTCRTHMARTCSCCTSRIRPGRVAERTIAVLLKSTEAVRSPWVRIPPLPLNPRNYGSGAIHRGFESHSLRLCRRP